MNVVHCYTALKCCVRRCSSIFQLTP